MTSTAKPIPDGASVVIPRLFCRDVAAAMDFCKNTFSAVERVRRPGPDGTVAHALMTIGPAMIMIEAEWPGMASRAPKPDGSSPVVIYVYVEDVDKTVEQAVAGGAKVLIPVANQFWGDRIGWSWIRRGTYGRSPRASRKHRRTKGGSGGRPYRPRADPSPFARPLLQNGTRAEPPNLVLSFVRSWVGQCANWTTALVRRLSPRAASAGSWAGINPPLWIVERVAPSSGPCAGLTDDHHCPCG